MSKHPPFHLEGKKEKKNTRIIQITNWSETQFILWSALFCKISLWSKLLNLVSDGALEIVVYFTVWCRDDVQYSTTFNKNCRFALGTSFCEYDSRSGLIPA